MQEQPILKPLPTEERYKLMEEFHVCVQGVNIYVPKYFVFDGASIPAAAWQMIFTPFHPQVMGPALVHDWLYHNHQTSREQADEIFNELLLANGVDSLKAFAIFQAVRVGGEEAWKIGAAELAQLMRLHKQCSASGDMSKYCFPEEVNAV